MAPIYSLVVPIFNEEAVLPVLLHRLDALLARLANLARGWSSIILVTTFLGGANMLMTGVLGVYIGRIHTEVKRPLYVVDRAVGFEAVAEAVPGRKPAPAVEARRA